jgi:hypothetical protein
MDFLFHLQLLIGVIAQSHSAETDLVESTTVQQLWAGVTTKKLILDIFSIRPNCQPRVSRSSRRTQVMLQTVTLFYINCGSGQLTYALVNATTSHFTLTPILQCSV